MKRPIAKSEDERCTSTLADALQATPLRNDLWRLIRCCYVDGHDGYHCEGTGRISWVNPERPGELGELPFAEVE